MTSFATVRVAAVQAAPVMLDLDASLDKAIALIRDAAAQGAQLIVLPECFLSFYPSSALTESRYDEAQIDLFERMWHSAVDVPGPEVDRLATVCAELGIHLSIGVNERETDRPGTLYNAQLLLGPAGLLSKHRKLMPTYQERLFHGMGDGDDLQVVDTAVGRIGGLVCWEHRMPLARYAVYRGGPQIWVAPTMDDRDIWRALMRTIAYESGAWVVSVCQYIHGRDLPKGIAADDRVYSEGGSAIIAADSGDVVAGPLLGEEGILVADCDLRTTLRAKKWFDAVGHYSREDVLLRVLAEPDDANGAQSNPRAGATLGRDTQAFTP